MPSLPHILFVCTYKGGRSQIARVYAERIGEGVFTADSACFDPSNIAPGFVDFVASLELQINKESPASVFDKVKDGETYDRIICMCSSSGTEMCALFRKNIEKAFKSKTPIEHWDLADFGTCQHAEEGFEACVKSICKSIEDHVTELKDSYLKNKTPNK